MTPTPLVQPEDRVGLDLSVALSVIDQMIEARKGVSTIATRTEKRALRALLSENQLLRALLAEASEALVHIDCRLGLKNPNGCRSNHNCCQARSVRAKIVEVLP